ncbi:hepatocyte cell adhesion molecule-like [Coregonus clupeaformis]|uniref:hepatocyte cell adhesion molecule-like n=1 Tax=Coregonus clupeaformis TaxID=59861 RepID=UPI001E1C2D7D|nr:hepatocyte cell adhesion molecule-like [Coregonus clupeaformis]XP_045070056.1 hepatocyte cell adhesion molecule-like [Coregonus clupeaformis]XP_045070057.1 hepatocyte cell adhesion molecule-like [Coregonus clupeaformis]
MDPLITIVLVVTAAAAQVSAMVCNLSQGNGTHQCYGALGESLSLHFGSHISNEQINLKKGDKRVLNFKTGEDWRSKLPQDYMNRSEFINNGTFRLDRVIEDDSGDYQLEIHNSEGTMMLRVNMLLVIQAPVSEPVLSHLCLPHGETVVTCSSEGDGLQYSWTLNGQNLTRSVAYDHYQNSVIILKSDVTGTLTCTVQNKVSSSNSTIDLPLACPVVSSQFPFVAVPVALTVGTFTLLLALFVGINHLCKKRRSRFDTSENGYEGVVYTVVKKGKQRNPARKQRPPATEMVEYGQIKMAVNPDVTASP